MQERARRSRASLLAAVLVAGTLAVPAGAQSSPPPDLGLTKTHQGNLTVGSDGTYVLAVTNVGAGATTGPITLTDTLPFGLGFVSGTGTG